MMMKRRDEKERADAAEREPNQKSFSSEDGPKPEPFKWKGRDCFASWTSLSKTHKTIRCNGITVNARGIDLRTLEEFLREANIKTR